MDVCKCIEPLQHRATLNTRPAASPLVWLVEEKESPDEFRGSRPDFVRQVALVTTTTLTLAWVSGETNERFVNAFNQLISRDPETFWTSGQWMTERRGGSDVANSTETVAVPDNGFYRLYGYKWFSSATDSNMALTLARIVQDNEASEDLQTFKGLTMFYVETRNSQGELNNMEIVKLKNKLGTRSLPTAELLLDGSIAYKLFDESRGIASISHMLNITRLHNAMASVGAMRRILQLSRDYSRKRIAFGKTLAEIPLHMRVLSAMEMEIRGSLLLGKKPVSTEAIEKVALQVEEDKSSNVLASTSVRRVAEALDLPRSTVQKIMRNILRYYPYKLQFVQELLPHDFETRHLFSLQFRTRCPSIYSEFRTLNREIAKDIKSHSHTQWEKHIEALSPEDNTLWRKSSLLPEVIADSLQEQFEPNHVADREEFDQRIHEEVLNFLATPHGQEIEPTTPTEVLTYVRRIKPKKSPGLDQITNRMIKNLPLKFLLFITLLINQLFKNNYFPDSWKTAVVIPILKPDKNPELAQNYRPISFLSSLSKVYEFVLLRRLNQHCAASNMIIPQQYGFRPKCSTVHQLLRVTELIHSGFAKHDATGILFLDIAKAFDKIWHDSLLIKLIRLDFPAPLIKSIHSFLTHRSFRVRVDRILSPPLDQSEAAFRKEV
ncbi:acyl-CoA dehydrogenase family member 11 [Trichonephila clavipes]|nr:acyl-CoA dehydrogenase family member 11 [Trichonephila clavipes]